MKEKRKQNGASHFFTQTDFNDEDGVLIGFHRANQSELDSVLGAAVRAYVEAGNPAVVAVHTLVTLAAETAFGTYGRAYQLAPLITILKALLYQLEQRTPKSFTEIIEDLDDDL